jgi:predicted TPR repeat methyltransferase
MKKAVSYSGTPLSEALPDFERFYCAMKELAPFMLSSIERQSQTFGLAWQKEFDTLINTFAGKTDKELHDAVNGYIEFAIDGMRLQKRFEKTRYYEPKSYEEAQAEVYDNHEYMFKKYLPGILLSHYIWPHHYLQLNFFRREIAPLIAQQESLEFCDVGPGTGFYSRQVLCLNENACGNAFDVSKHSLAFSKLQVEAFGVADRFVTNKQNIVTSPTDKQFDFLMSVEVLEHLEDPISFLAGLKVMMKPNAYGFITAAVTAANDDHIYLYHSGEEVAEQLRQVGFSIVGCQFDKAYEPRGDEPVPINAAFLVQNG